jgi:lipoate synthase
MVLKRMIIVNFVTMGSFVKPSMTFIDMKETVDPDE